MTEIVRIQLDNEMDLILAHKRAMKLLELCGNGLSAQTTFATAVSEIARCSIGEGIDSHLILGINTLSKTKKNIVAVLYDRVNLKKLRPTAFNYAERLSGGLADEKQGDFYTYTLSSQIRFSSLVTDSKIRTFGEFFENEPAISPYDEIRRKNLQLIALSEELSKSEEQYRHLADSSPQLIFSMNLNREITLVNKNFKKFFGSEFVNFSHLKNDIFHTEDMLSFAPLFETAVSEKKPFQSQIRLKGNNAYIWHLVSLAPLKDEQGNLVRWNGFFVDINAQKLIEETLRDNRDLKEIQQKLVANQELLQTYIEDLTQKNSDLEQFAHIVSHDLQEPLRKIQFFSSFYNGDNEKLKKEYSTKIFASADRMRNLISGIQDYSLYNGQKKEFNLVKLSDVLSDVVTDFELAITEKKAEIHIGSLPSVEGNYGQLYRLFANLLSNSLKFSPGSPVVRVDSQTVGSDGPDFLRPNVSYYLITFSDNGMGFDQDLSDFIFKIFKRLDVSAGIGGTGLGLAIARKIVEHHSGFITVQSSSGNGAAFKIYLPFS